MGEYYEDDVRFWRERALRLGELARPVGGVGSVPAADQYTSASGKAPSPSGRGHSSFSNAIHDGWKTAYGNASGGGGYRGGSEGGAMRDWDRGRDLSADAASFPAATAAEHPRRGGGGGGGERKGGRWSSLDQLLAQRQPPQSSQDPGRLRQHVELHETVAGLHGIAADLVERSNGLEARLSDLAERKAAEQIRFARSLEARVQAAAAPLESRRDSLMALASDVESLLGKFVGILAGLEPEPRSEDDWSRLRAGVERTRRMRDVLLGELDGALGGAQDAFDDLQRMGDAARGYLDSRFGIDGGGVGGGGGRGDNRGGGGGGGGSKGKNTGGGGGSWGGGGGEMNSGEHGKENKSRRATPPAKTPEDTGARTPSRTPTRGNSVRQPKSVAAAHDQPSDNDHPHVTGLGPEPGGGSDTDELRRLRLELETERAARENAEARAEALAGNMVGIMPEPDKRAADAAELAETVRQAKAEARAESAAERRRHADEMLSAQEEAMELEAQAKEAKETALRAQARAKAALAAAAMGYHDGGSLGRGGGGGGFGGGVGSKMWPDFGASGLAAGMAPGADLARIEALRGGYQTMLLQMQGHRAVEREAAAAAAEAAASELEQMREQQNAMASRLAAAAGAPMHPLFWHGSISHVADASAAAVEAARRGPAFNTDVVDQQQQRQQTYQAPGQQQPQPRYPPPSHHQPPQHQQQQQQRQHHPPLSAGPSGSGGASFAGAMADLAKVAQQSIEAGYGQRGSGGGGGDRGGGGGEEAAHEAVSRAAQQAAAAAAAAAAGGSPAVVAAALAEMAAALRRAEHVAAREDASAAATAERTENRTKHVEAMLSRATGALQEEVRMSGQSFTEILDQLRMARERASSASGGSDVEGGDGSEGDRMVSEVLRRVGQDGRAAAAADSPGIISGGKLSAAWTGMSSGAGSGGGDARSGGGGGSMGGSESFGGFGVGTAPPASPHRTESLGGSSSGLYDLSPTSEHRSALKAATAGAKGYRAEQQRWRQRTSDNSDGDVGGSGLRSGPVPSVSSPERVTQRPQPQGVGIRGSGGGGGGSGGGGGASGSRNGSRQYGIHTQHGGGERTDAGASSGQPQHQYHHRVRESVQSLESVVAATTDGGTGTFEVVGPAELMVDSFGTLTKIR